MKTFIVPTDFSDTSKNAARYAGKLAEKLSDAEVILYTVFDKFDTESSDGSVVYNDHEARRKVMELALENVKKEVLEGAPNAKLSTYAEEETSFTDSLERLARHKNADMIIMGITGASKLAQILVGSNTLKMVDKNVCPVMIVPPNATFTGVENIAFTSDLKDVEKTTPAKSLRAVLDLFNPFIHVVNVDSEHYVQISEEYDAQRKKLDNILSGYETEYYFIRQYDFVDAINQFVSDYKIDMILTVPKNHSFLETVFKTSHTKQLAYHSHVPLIAVHE